MADIGVFTPDQARLLWQFYLSSTQESSGRKYSRVERPRRLRVAIVGELAAPASSGDTPTTFECAVLKMDPTTKVLTPTDFRIDGTNYTTGLTASDGTYGKIEFDSGVWELYWVDCAASAEFEGLLTREELEAEEEE